MNVWVQSIRIGAVTGIRSTAGLRAAGDGFGFERYHKWFNRAVWLEGVGDKLPWIPARTMAPSLIARGALGGASAVALDRQGSRRKRLLLGAVGAAAAIAMAHAATGARRFLGRRSRFAGAAGGLLEDAVVAAAVRSRRAA